MACTAQVFAGTGNRTQVNCMWECAEVFVVMLWCVHNFCQLKEYLVILTASFYDMNQKE